jgi:pimeloyl-ACP methyl ester carboxylesterase
MTRPRLVIFVVTAFFSTSGVGDTVSPELDQAGNLRLETKVDGAGRPAVIFESGFTGGLFLWGPVQTEVAKQTLTLSYERAGLGRSDPGPEPRNAEQIARELHALLVANAIVPP